MIHITHYYYYYFYHSAKLRAILRTWLHEQSHGFMNNHMATNTKRWKLIILLYIYIFKNLTYIEYKAIMYDVLLL